MKLWAMTCCKRAANGSTTSCPGIGSSMLRRSALGPPGFRLAGIPRDMFGSPTLGVRNPPRGPRLHDPLSVRDDDFVAAHVNT